jgi:hypothetical protein
MIPHVHPKAPTEQQHTDRNTHAAATEALAISKANARLTTRHSLSHYPVAMAHSWPVNVAVLSQSVAATTLQHKQRIEQTT